MWSPEICNLTIVKSILKGLYQQGEKEIGTADWTSKASGFAKSRSIILAWPGTMARKREGMFSRFLHHLLTCAALGVLPADAQLQGGSLERSGGLSGNQNGLQTARGGVGQNNGQLQAGRLQSGELGASTLKSAKLEASKSPQGAGQLNPTKIKLMATQIAEGGLGVEEIQGALSTIPQTQVGVLLYDVAEVLRMMEKEMTGVAVGYYMAVLADTEGKRHDDALRRLMEILLDKDLGHERAVQLYDGGLETMRGLVEIGIGLTEDGHRASLRTLQEVKAAYHIRRKRAQTDANQEAAGESEKGPLIRHASQVEL